MRNLIVCSDGTWNTPDQKKDNIPTPTNVVRIYNAISEQNSDNIEQLKYYHPGVGAEGSWWEKLAGGTVGVGLSKNIKSAYKWLAYNYQPGDRIFLFGFSRGAYTVRSLAGMVSKCKLLKLQNLSDDELWRRVDVAYKQGYRKKIPLKKWANKLEFHENENGDTTIPIYFLGVWDTVGALGIPNNLAILNLLDSVHKYSFHDTKLSNNVKNARHAVAIDEKRASFSPTLWTNANKRKSEVKQLWFIGVHSNVGGGYPDKGLSDIALEWMMKESTDLGLGLRDNIMNQINPNSQGIIYDSQHGIFSHLRSSPRSLPAITKESDHNHLIHYSVFDRQNNPPIEESNYHKTKILKKSKTIKLNIYAKEHWNKTGIYLEKGIEYQFEASGQWMDRNIKCGPEGADDGNFSIGEVAHLAGSLIGSLEEFYKKVTGNNAADFIGTKREEKMPWFALIGSIANGGNPSKDGTPKPHETFEIGKKRIYKVKKSGYLYAYSNDAWDLYSNNRGSVTLKITQFS